METELERLGRILAADQQLRVHVRGAVAYATPGEVVLPNLSTWETLGRHAKRMLHGLLDHETAHSKWSDFVLVEAVATLDASVLYRYGIAATPLHELRPVLKTLFNMVEDAWIERKQGERWKGARENLDRKNHWFWDVGSKGSKSARERIESDETASPMNGYVLAACMVTRGVQPIKAFKFAPTIHKMLKLTAAELKRAPLCESSVEALHVAIEIAKKLKEASEKKPEPEPEPESEDSPEPSPESSDDDSESTEGAGDDDERAGDDDDEDSDEGEGEEDTEAEDESDESEEGEDEGGEGDGESEAADEDESADEADEADDADLTEVEFAVDEKKPGNPEDAIGSEIKRALFSHDGVTRPYVNYSKEYDVEVDLSGGAWVDPPHGGVVHALVEAFEVALRSRRDRHPVSGNDEGEVDSTLLAGFSLGAIPADELFLQWVSEDDKNTAVQIVVDCSASMGSASTDNSKASIARETTKAMSHALQMVGVPHEIVGFTTVSDKFVGRHPWLHGCGPEVQRKLFELRRGLEDQRRRGVDVTAFAREMYGGTELGSTQMLVPVHAIFKGFDSDSLAGLKYLTGIHENLDGEGVDWAAARLLARPEPRKVMLVLSDGMPVGSRSASQGRTFLRERVEAVTALGIEVCGIGIASDSVKSFYTSHVVVNDLRHLEMEAVHFMTEVLLKNKQEGSWL